MSEKTPDLSAECKADLRAKCEAAPIGSGPWTAMLMLLDEITRLAKERDEAFTCDPPFAWADIKAVRETSVVNPSVMLLSERGACIGLVTVLQCESEAVRGDVERALNSAGNPAKMRRFMNAARNGEAEAYDAAVKAEAAQRECAAEVARIGRELGEAQARIDRYEAASLENDAEWRRQLKLTGEKRDSALAENATLLQALQEAITHLEVCRVFVQTNVMMHQQGLALHEEIIARGHKALEKTNGK